MPSASQPLAEVSDALRSGDYYAAEQRCQDLLCSDLDLPFLPFVTPITSNRGTSNH
jgi:hypothetical protein